MQTSTTHTSLELAKANKEGKETHNSTYTRHLSFQNFILCLFTHKKGTHMVPILPDGFPKPTP